MRIALGALLAAALIAAGEWARRTERLAGLSGLPTAHIPSILTAAGTTVAYADVYAAHALYGFLAPGSAFILLGLVALATLAAALLHGPALAGLGLVGAYVTPLLVASQRPDYWSLYVYLAVVTAAAFALARFRMWRWLAITAVAFSALWTLPGIGVVGVDALGAHAFHVIVGFALAASLIVAGLWFGPDALPGRIDGVSSAALGAYLLAATLLVLVSRHDPLALATFAVLAAATVAIAWRAEAATAAVPAAAVLVVLVFVRWAADLDIERLVMPSGPVAGAVPEPPKANVGWHLVLGAGFALLFGGAGYLAQGRSERAIVPVLWSAAAVFAPIAILAALYYRIAGFEPSIPFAAAALLLSALYAFATETLDKRAPRPGLAAASAIFATGAVAALALALTLALERGWLTVALALMVPGIAWVSDKRPLPALRVLAAVIGVLVLARIGWEPRIVGDDVGTRPIFNWLLYGYGIPAAAFWLGGYLLRRRGDDVPARMVDVRRHPADRAAGLPGNPPLHQWRRRLPGRLEPGRDRAAGLRRARHDHRARAAAAALPQRGPRRRRAGDRGADAGGHRARARHDREPVLHRRAGRRALRQSHPARLRPAGGADRDPRAGVARSCVRRNTAPSRP